MSVPDNFTFSLEDVASEIGCTGTLADCFYYASDLGWDPNYYGEEGLRRFRNYTHIYFNVTNGSYQEFSWTGNSPCGDGYFNVDTNLSWYATVDQSEIVNASIDPDSGGGSTYVYCYPNESNFDGWVHLSEVVFYRSDNNDRIASVNIVQKAYGDYC